MGRDAGVLLPLMSRLDAPLIATTRATLIQQWGTGLEGVDIAAATARGIPVCNVPSDVTPNAESTAEHAVFLMLGVARQLHACAHALKAHRLGTPRGDALFGNRALIVGFGRVGQALARRLVALGMQVDAIRQHPDPADIARYGLGHIANPSAFLTLAATADFVISTVPLTADSRGLFNAALFRVMQRSAAVINVSRGAVIDESALLDALQTGRIAGAGLDVFVEEPVPPDHPLLALDTVVATPHVAGVTRQNYDAIAQVVAANIARVKQGNSPQYRANSAV